MSTQNTDFQISKKKFDTSRFLPHPESPPSVFFVDMSGFDALSPEILSMLAEVKKKCAAKNIEVRLSGVSVKMRILLKKTLLDLLFEEQKRTAGGLGDGPSEFLP